MEKDNRRIDAFTLIEIMAVVIIIGLLTGIVGTAIFQRVDQGKVTAAAAQDYEFSSRAIINSESG